MIPFLACFHAYKTCMHTRPDVYKTCVVSPREFWLDWNLPKYEPWIDIKLVWYATKAYQKGMITYKCQNNQNFELADSYTYLS